MRASRFSVLSQPRGIVHLFWRCHDKKFLLNFKGAKKLFFECLISGLKHRNSDGSVKLHAFCLMDNHVHQQLSYENGPKQLSHVMRVAHGIFGRRFNDRFKRSGKVANERPKTPLIGDENAQMRVHFYIESNPIRAGLFKLEKLRKCFWNSYRYYAFGEEDEWTKHLTPPAWYIRLGGTAEDRQKAYRSLFAQYLEGFMVKTREFHRQFIGSVEWVRKKRIELKELLKLGQSPRKPLSISVSGHRWSTNLEPS